MPAIHLVFSDPEGKTLRRGPYRKFVLQGETLREDVGASPIAVHEGHHWELEGRKFTRFDCDCGVEIHLTRVDGKRTVHHGPYKSFSAQDGVTFADHSIFAFADRSIGDWYCHSDGMHWAILIVEAVELPAGGER